MLQWEVDLRKNVFSQFILSLFKKILAVMKNGGSIYWSQKDSQKH